MSQNHAYSNIYLKLITDKVLDLLFEFSTQKVSHFPKRQCQLQHLGAPQPWESCAQFLNRISLLEKGSIYM
jgi:hypothetical protein